MPRLPRKIWNTKWIQNEIEAGEPPSADAVTQDLWTDGNCLSLWRVPDGSNVDDAVVAQVTMFEHLESIDVVCVDEQALRDRGVIIEDVPGETKIPELAALHVHAADLDVNTLSEVAKTIGECKRTENCMRYVKGQLARLLAAAVHEGRLDIADLKEDVRPRVERALQVIAGACPCLAGQRSQLLY